VPDVFKKIGGVVRLRMLFFGTQMVHKLDEKVDVICGRGLNKGLISEPIMFNRNNTLITKFRLFDESDAGFTLVELIVVVAVTSMLLVILISNFTKTRSQFALSRTAYKFAQDIRRVQGMALSTSQYRDSEGVLHQVEGYGVYVDLANPKQYVMYADVDGNRFYDGSITDYVVETVNLEPGVVMSNLDSVDKASVDFLPPIPLTKILWTSDCAGDPDPDCPDGLLELTITFQSEIDPTQTKNAYVNNAGLAEVQ